MKINKTLTALLASASIGMSGQVLAAGTPADTSITNTTKLTFSVDSQSQDDVFSDDLTFKVDRKVDFTLILQDSADIPVTPGKSYTAKYLLTNTGNDSLDFTLAANNIADLSSGVIIGEPTADPLVTRTLGDDLSNVEVFIEFDGEYDPSGGPQGSSFLSGTDIGTSVTALKMDWAQVIYVSATANGIDTDILAASLTVTSPLANDNGEAFTPGAVQNVFADIDFDGTEVRNTSFKVVTAKFTHGADIPGVGLSINVINDTMCTPLLVASTAVTDYSSTGDTVCTLDDNNASTLDDTYYPKAIPGAMVQYTITATNSGSAPATGVIFTQDLISSHGDAINLQDDSLANVTMAFIDSSDSSGNTTAILNTAVDDNNDLKIDLTAIPFDDGDSITITFTAIVE